MLWLVFIIIPSIEAIPLSSELKIYLEENTVFVNEIEEKRRGKKLFSGDLVEINGQKFVVKLKK